MIISSPFFTGILNSPKLLVVVYEPPLTSTFTLEIGFLLSLSITDPLMVKVGLAVSAFCDSPKTGSKHS